MTENVSKQFRKDQYFEAKLTVVYRLSRPIADRQRAVFEKVLNEPGRGTRDEQGRGFRL